MPPRRPESEKERPRATPAAHRLPRLRITLNRPAKLQKIVDSEPRVLSVEVERALLGLTPYHRDPYRSPRLRRKVSGTFA